MSNPHWFESWHGAKLPSTVISGAVGGGSTAMSTGVTNALSTKAGVGHTHGSADISSLASTLSGLAAAISTKAAGSHTHPQSDVTNLESTITALEAKISTKAAGSHTHPQSAITNLESTITALEAKISTKAAGSHTHAQADVTDLTSTLAALTSALSTKASLNAGVVPTAQLGGGSADNSVFLRGDQTWAAPTAVAAGVIPSTWAVCSTHVLTGSTTMQSVTGLSFGVSSAAVYRFEFTCGWQTTSSAAGIAFGLNGPANPTLLTYEWDASTGMGGILTRAHHTFGAQQIAVPQSSAANVTMYGYLGGVVRTGADAGTVQLQFASEVAGSTVSVRAGSVGFLFGPL